MQARTGKEALCNDNDKGNNSDNEGALPIMSAFMVDGT